MISQPFQIYHKPRYTVVSGRPMWLWRRGGYNPAENNYGRCYDKKTARLIIAAHLAERKRVRRDS